MPTKAFPLSIATAVFLAFGGDARAQVEITSAAPEGAYVEMTTDELRSLVGKVQRLRVQRAKQYAYLRAQREAAGQGAVPSTGAPGTAPVAGAPLSDPRIAAIDRDVDELTRQIALLRSDVQRGAFRQNDPNALADRSLRRDGYYPDDARRDDARRDDVDFRLRDERARYDRDLRDERDRYRRLERDLDDLRRDRDLGRPRDVGQGLGYGYAPRGGGLDYNRYAPANGAVTIRDTVIVNQAGERVVVRDTVRDTRVVTRTIVEDRIDLAAVLFAHNSTVITPAAALQIEQAVEAYRRQPQSQLLLRGFASRVGDVRYNQELSMRRAESVRDRLTGAGVPVDHIRLIGNGEDPTDQLASGRRVEIQLLPRP